ncbi:MULTISPECIES: hypothetical protein [unclassified Brachybacterium]|uniref:hypothetical protein n=1 Tax=unclassified Brachybacterium TaxID=2623841 RepID=UPI000C80B47B|nr:MULTISPECIES: hypothetical protein [unclassified Brachybacterium]PMC74872.1 hypothetical protein CJ197_11300 [Brachybacterium sp. UMB0905]
MTDQPMPPGPPAPGPSPMERQGELLRDLATVLLSSLDLTESWAGVGAAFIPHAEEWAGRIVITDRDGTASGGDATFATDSQITLLLDALQQATAEQEQAFVSVRLDFRRPAEDPDRIALSTDFTYDEDPGSFDGLGGIDRAYAYQLASRVGADRVPAWVREMLPEV